MTNLESPKMIPVIGNSLAYGWEIMKKYFLPLLLVIIVCGFVESAARVIGYPGYTSQVDHARKVNIGFGGFPAMAIWLLLLPIILYGADMLFVRAVRNEKLDFKELIEGFNNYLNIVLAHLFSTALIGISCVALIIPGIIVACRLVFVSYLVVDKGLDPIAAVETSWKMTKGHGWRILRLGFTCFLIGILGLICLIVGIFPAIIWCKASFAALYEAILNERTDLFPIAGGIEQGT